MSTAQPHADAAAVALELLRAGQSVAAVRTRLRVELGVPTIDAAKIVKNAVAELALPREAVAYAEQQLRAGRPLAQVKTAVKECFDLAGAVANRVLDTAIDAMVEDFELGEVDRWLATAMEQTNDRQLSAAERAKVEARLAGVFSAYDVVTDPDSTARETAAAALKIDRLLALGWRAKLPAGCWEPGESLHVITTSRMDLTDVLNCLLEKLGRCDRLAIATLGYGPRNLRMMLGWLDSGSVGTLTLLASIFFKAHNAGLFAETLTAFRERKQRFACAPCHAKVVSTTFASGQRLTVEGSSNLRASGSVREQLALIHDHALTAWHARWIEELVTKYEGNADE